MKLTSHLIFARLFEICAIHLLLLHIICVYSLLFSPENSIVRLILRTIFSAWQAREAATTFQGKLVDAQRRKGKGSLPSKFVVASVDCCIEIAITEESGIPVFWHMVVVLAVTVCMPELMLQFEVAVTGCMLTGRSSYISLNYLPFLCMLSFLVHEGFECSF